MDNSVMAKQLEFYSNAIIGFIVSQGLAICYAFGTSKEFNIILKAPGGLSFWLAAHLFVSVVLALAANRLICRSLEVRLGKEADLIRSIYLGKAIVIGLFGLLPIAVVLRYAALSA